MGKNLDREVGGISEGKGGKVWGVRMVEEEWELWR